MLRPANAPIQTRAPYQIAEASKRGNTTVSGRCRMRPTNTGAIARNPGKNRV